MLLLKRKPLKNTVIILIAALVCWQQKRNQSYFWVSELAQTGPTYCRGNASGCCARNKLDSIAWIDAKEQVWSPKQQLADHEEKLAGKHSNQLSRAVTHPADEELRAGYHFLIPCASCKWTTAPLLNSLVDLEERVKHRQQHSHEQRRAGFLPVFLYHT